MTTEEARFSDSIKQLVRMLREQWVSINQQVDELEAELRSIVERWFLGNIPPVFARHCWGSASAGTPISARCWSMAHAACCASSKILIRQLDGGQLR
jgi:hypothetical protein